MGGKRRKATDIKELIEPEQIERGIHQLPHLKIKALGSFLYLTGARISEVTGHKPIKYEGIKTNQLIMENIDGKDFLIVKKVPCLKRKKGDVVFRNIPISLEENKELISYILQYKKQRETEEPVKDFKYPRLFNLCRQGAWKMVDRHFNWFTHFFRHLRTTHLTERYSFNPADLKEYHGWTTIAPADKYVHLNYMRIAKKMK